MQHAYAPECCKYIVINCETVDHIVIEKLHGISDLRNYKTAEVTSGNLITFFTTDFAYVLKHINTERNLAVFT
jgi:hypothetical protein